MSRTAGPGPEAPNSAPAGAGPGRRAWAGPLALGLLLGLVFAWLFGHLDFQHQWDNDEGIIALGGRAVLDGYRPYLDFWLDQPPGAPAALALAFRLAGSSVLAARALCLALGLLGALALAAIGRRLAGWAAGLAAALALVLAPHFFWLARSVNLDVPSMALGSLALALAWRRRDGGGRATLFLGGLALGLGASVKLTALVVLAPLAVLWADTAHRRLHAGAGRGPVARAALADGTALAAGLALVAATWLLAAPPAALLDGVFGRLDAARAVFPNRAAEYATWLVTENLLGENLGLVALATFGLAWLATRRRGDAWVLAAWLAASCLAIVAQRPMWPKHHFSLVLWPLAAMAGVGVAGLLALARDRALPGGRALAALGLACAGLWLFSLPGTVGRLRETATVRPFAAGLDGLRWLAANTAPTDPIISDNGLLPLRSGRPMAPSMIALSTKRIRLGDVDDETIIAAAEAGPAKAILLWNDQLTDFKRFLAWLPTRYVLAAEVGEGRQIWQRADAGLVARAEDLRFGEVARLEGHTVGATRARPGDTVPLTLLWRALGPTAAPYSAFAHLVGPDGRALAQADAWPGANTALWPPGSLALDERAVTLPPDTPPGEYRFVVGLYDPTSGQRLPARDASGHELPGGAVGLEPPLWVGTGG